MRFIDWLAIRRGRKIGSNVDEKPMERPLDDPPAEPIEGHRAERQDETTGLLPFRHHRGANRPFSLQPKRHSYERIANADCCLVHQVVRTRVNCDGKGTLGSYDLAKSPVANLEGGAERVVALDDSLNGNGHIAEHRSRGDLDDASQIKIDALIARLPEHAPDGPLPERRRRIRMPTSGDGKL